MRVIIGCEESQKICIAFRNKGHEAYSCDLKPCSGGHPEWHIQGDVLEILNDNWHIGIFHPTCTYLSHAGNGYFNVLKYGTKVIEREEKRQLAKIFFLQLLNCPIPKICVENPVGYMNHIIKPDQVIHPYMFGDSDKKRTCLWLKNLPLLIHSPVDTLFENKTHVNVNPTYIDKSGKARYFTEAITGFKKNRQELRSKTFPGIAKSMAEQWG